MCQVCFHPSGGAPALAGGLPGSGEGSWGFLTFELGCTWGVLSEVQSLAVPQMGLHPLCCVHPTLALSTILKSPPATARLETYLTMSSSGEERGVFSGNFEKSSGSSGCAGPQHRPPAPHVAREGDVVGACWGVHVRPEGGVELLSQCLLSPHVHGSHLERVWRKGRWGHSFKCSFH